MSEKIELSPEAKAAKNAYQRQYYRDNAKRINAMQNAWKKANPDKVRLYRAHHWENLAKRMAEENNPENTENE